MKRLQAIFLLCIFAISNFASAIEMHYCRGELTTISVFGNADCHCESKAKDDCCLAEEFVPEEHVKCSHSDHETHEKIEKQECCESNMVELSSAEVTIDHLIHYSPIVTLFVLADYSLFETIISSPCNGYSVDFNPPLPEKNRQVLFQSFLI